MFDLSSSSSKGSVPIWSFSLPHHAGLVLAHPDRPNLFILNHSAAFLWSLTQQHGLGQPDQLADLYASHFGLANSQAAADVNATLQHWSHTLFAPYSTPTLVPTTPSVPPPTSALFQADYSLGATSFRLVAYDPDFVAEIRPRLAHLTVTAVHPSQYTFHIFRSPHDRLYWVVCGEATLGAESDLSVARTILLQEMARLAHHPNTQWLAILHAAAVASPQTGHSLILPAATNSGKSTLTAALLHSGLHLLSDDSAALDQSSGHLIPLPFALMLREGSWPILTPYFPELAATPTHYHHGSNPVRFLPPPNPSGPALPRAIVFANYRPNAQTHLEPLNTLDTLYALQKSGFWLPHTESHIAAFLSWLQSLPTYQLTYSDLSSAVPVIHCLCSQ